MTRALLIEQQPYMTLNLNLRRTGGPKSQVRTHMPTEHQGRQRSVNTVDKCTKQGRTSNVYQYKH